MIAAGFDVVMANDIYARGPGALSTNVFWVQEGKISTLHTSAADGRYQLMPSTEFARQVLLPLQRQAKLN